MRSAKQFFLDERPQRGFTIDAFKQRWHERLNQPMKGLDKETRRFLYYSRYNWDRMKRVELAYAPSDAFKNAVSSVKKEQLWMLLSEDWCVDSAYALPILDTADKLNVHICVRILERDANLDIMDQYLTNGGRAIPKLVVFDHDGKELFTWGAKPAALVTFRDKMKSDGAEGSEITQATLDWYEGGGLQEIEKEIGAHLLCLQDEKILLKLKGTARGVEDDQLHCLSSPVPS